MSEWGDRIRTMREAAGMTQGQLAKAVGLSQGAISNYEAGTRRPERLMVLAVAEACSAPLRLAFDALRELDGDLEPEEQRVLLRLLCVVHAAQGDQRRKIVAALDSLIDLIEVSDR